MSMMSNTIESSLFLFSINNLHGQFAFFLNKGKYHMAIITEPWGDNRT